MPRPGVTGVTDVMISSAGEEVIVQTIRRNNPLAQAVRAAMASPAPAAAPEPEKFWEIRAAGDASEAEIFIFGDVGESWWGESVTAKTFVDELKAIDAETLYVRVNSYGGSVSDGLAIHNAIRRHQARAIVTVEGVAVSIASLIAMAGDEIHMAENSLLMIHAPWTVAMGNSAEMRQVADTLDTYARAMASSYARKSGMAVDDVLDLLTDGADHWYTAEEALDAGFADQVIDALPIAAGLLPARFTVPAAIAASLRPEAHTMPKQTPPATPAPSNAPAPAAPSTPAPSNPPAPADPVAPDNVVAIQAAAEAQAMRRIVERNAALEPLFARFPGHDSMAALHREILADPAVTLEQAREKMLAKLAEGAESLAGDPRVTVHEADKIRGAAEQALLYRAGIHRLQGAGVPALAIDMNGNPFRGQTLLDVARGCLLRAGKRPDGMDKRELVAAAFQTTSEFPTLLENVMHKSLLRSWAVAPDTWRRFCATGQVSDFRAHNRYRTGSIGNLDSLTAHGEYKRKQIPDGEKSSITASTKGNLIAVTRETIINDDLGALTNQATMLGRAAARTVEAAVYALLAENSGKGPILEDGVVLFHSSHGNLVDTGSGGVPTVAAFEALRVLIAEQMDISGNDYLDLRPAIWLGNTANGGAARVVNDAQYDPDTSNKLQRPNMVRGLVRDVIDSPRPASAPWYLFADPMDAPVIEVAFLDGAQEPFLESKNGWEVDGAELKVRLDYGVAALDYRGAALNMGA
jgi:ATP-dependent protease ClpP protease subunit